MYGLDKNQKLSFLESKELQQVCIGQYQVVLNFTDQISIAMECEYEIESNDQKERGESRIPESAKSLLKLVGSGILNASNLGMGCLQIEFARGIILRIYDSNENAESYEIISPEGSIIV